VAKIPESVPTASNQATVKASPSPTKPPASLLGNKVSTGSSLLDRFMALLFRFGKTFASLLAVLCLLAVFASIAVFVFHMRTKIEVPTYEEISFNTTEDNEDASTNTADLDERRAIEKKFGDDVVDIIKNHKLSQQAYDIFIQIIQSIQPDNRQKYLSGLEDVLEKRDQVAKESKSKTLEVEDVVEKYTEYFNNAESAHEEEKQEAKAIRWGALAAVFIFCFMLFMMLIVPALLRIEENTRQVV
jgi:hypothetical protein